MYICSLNKNVPAYAEHKFTPPPFFVSPKNCGSNRNSLMVAKLSLNCYLCRTQINPPFFFVSPKNCGSIRKILMIPKLCLNCYNVKIQCIYMKLYITQLIVLPVLRSTMIDLLLQWFQHFQLFWMFEQF